MDIKIISHYNMMNKKNQDMSTSKTVFFLITFIWYGKFAFPMEESLVEHTKIVKKCAKDPVNKAIYTTYVRRFKTNEWKGVVTTGNQTGVNARSDYSPFLSLIAAHHHVLDVGGGVGYFAEEALKKGAQVTLLDPDYKAANIRQEKRLNVEGILGTIQTFTEQEKYDRVVSINMLQYIPPEQVSMALERMAKALKPRGILMLRIPDYPFLLIQRRASSLIRGDSAPYLIESSELFSPYEKTIETEIRKRVPEIDENGRHLSEEEFNKAVGEKIEKYGLSPKERAELVECFGDHARFTFDPLSYLPKKITYLGGGISDLLSKIVPFKVVRVFNSTKIDPKTRMVNPGHLNIIAIKNT